MYPKIKMIIFPNSWIKKILYNIYTISICKKSFTENASKTLKTNKQFI